MGVPTANSLKDEGVKTAYSALERSIHDFRVSVVSQHMQGLSALVQSQCHMELGTP